MSIPLTLTARPFPEHLSHSQVSTFMDCAEKYRLERGFNIPSPPGWALIGGKATHVATEYYDLAREGKLSWEPQSPVRGIDFAGSEVVDGVELEVEQEGPSADEAKGPASGTDPQAQEHAILCELALECVTLTPADLAGRRMPTQLAALWEAAFGQEIAREAAASLDTFPDRKSWKVSGRVSKTHPDKENETAWYAQGALFLKKYVLWRLERSWNIAYVDSKPAIELDVSAVIGGVSMKGFLDRIYWHPHERGQTILTDIKTSQDEPTDPEQLGLYKVCLETLGLPGPAYGGFYMTRTGNMGVIHDLSRYDLDYFTWKLQAVKRQRDAGELLANPGSKWCKFCDMSEYCYAKSGRKAHLVPKLWQHAPEANL